MYMNVFIFLWKFIFKVFFLVENCINVFVNGVILLCYLLIGVFNELFLSFEGYLMYKIY